MKTRKLKFILASVCVLTVISTVFGQPSITFLALRGQPQTPNDQPPHGTHFYITAPLTTLSANALGLTVPISPGALVYFNSPTVSGGGPFTYQWQLNGGDLPGETNSTLYYPGVEPSPGVYTLVVTDAANQSTTSEPVTIVVEPTFTKITSDPVATAYEQRTSSVGASWGDYDNDGYLDLVTCGGLDGVAGKSQLFHNNGDGTFTQITSGPPVDTAFIANNTAIWGDYDNDGNLDLFVGGVNLSTLYHNNGAPGYTFTQVNSGFPSNVKYGAAWADYDNDGFLDLFLPTFDPNANSHCFLYRNNGDGTFSQATNAGAIVTDLAASVGCAWADYDNDGKIDLFVTGGRGTSQPAAPNRLYHNNGDGTFTLATNAGSIVTDTGYMGGCAWGDYNNDGCLDLFVMGYYTNFLYRNNGNGTFTRVTGPIVSNSPTGWFYVGNHPIACAWGDYDNDGFLDLFMTDEASTGTGLIGTVNTLYHNNGDGTFTQVAAGSPTDEVADSFACSWVDYDNDGFLDLFATRGDGRGHYLYHNNLQNAGNTNAWLTVKLVGTVSNRSAIGAKVRVKAFYRGQSRWQLRQITGGQGDDNGSCELRAHFGLGDATTADTVRIEWPSGTVQEFHNVAPRQILTYTEPPRLLASVTNGAPKFCVKGGRFMQYDVQVSTNLMAWAPLATLTITNLNGVAFITDPGASGLDRRFYRAVSR
jgi:ASPIC and UnbV/FG-GAP-like repeat